MLAPEIHGLFIASLIIFIGFIGSVLLNRHNIPDAIFLIVLGYILGPLTGIVDVNSLSSVAPILGALALIAIMFESSFGINLKELVVSAKSSLILATVGFIISSIVTYLFLYYVVGFYPENPLFSLMIGTIIGGGSGAIIASIVQRINAPPSIQVSLSLESVLTDVFVIIFTSIIAYMITNLSVIEPEKIAANIATKFSTSIVIGVLAGFLLAYILDRLRKESHLYTMTIAYLILLYVATEFFGGSGAISVLSSGIVLTNLNYLPNIFSSERIIERIHFQLYSLESMHSELTLLIRIFFFVEVGIIMNIKDLYIVSIAAVLSILLLLARYPLAYAVTPSLGFREKRGIVAMLISLFYARGLAAAVMAVVISGQILSFYNPVPADLEYAVNFMVQVASAVVLFTNLILTIGVFLLRNKIKELIY